MGIAKGTPQHGHIDTRNDFELAALYLRGETLCNIARRGAKYIREDDGIGIGYSCKQLPPPGFYFFSGHGGRNVKRLDPSGAFGIGVLSHNFQRRSKWRMGNDQKSWHMAALSIVHHK